MKKTTKQGSAWRRVLALIGIMTGLAPALLQAGNAFWSKTAADGNWGTGANWTGGTAPGTNDGTTISPDIAVFSNASSTTLTLPDANRNIAGFLFTNAACAVYTNGSTAGNKLLLSSGGSIFLTTGLGSNQVINAPLELEGNGGSYTFTNASAKTLTIGGTINGVSTAGNTNTLFLTGSAGGTISGAISDGIGGGRLALAKSGSGQWTLSASNTHSGGITLNAGTLGIYNAAALGTGRFAINGGSITPGSSLTLAGGIPSTWNGSFALNNNNNYNLNTGTGPVTLASNITITTTGDGYGALSLTVGGPITDDGGNRSLTVVGVTSPTVQLDGSNTFSGGLFLNSGTLRPRNPFAVGTGTITISGGAIGTYYNGPTITLSNNNPMIWAGNFSFTSSGPQFDLGKGPISLTGSRIIGSAGGSKVIGGVIANSGGSNFSLTLNGGDVGTTFYLNGANTFDGGLTFNPSGGPTAGSYDAYLGIGNLGSNTSASAVGTGTLTLGAQSTSTAYKNTLKIDNSSGAAGTLATANAQKWNGNLTFTGSKSLNMGTGAVTLGTNVTVTVLANTLTIGGPISGSNAWFSLTKAGAGELVLGGANTYTGGTTVTAGRLTVNTNGTLSTGNVYVWTNGVLALQNGNAIAPSATLTLATNWPSCYVVLSNSVPNVIAKLIVGTNTYTHPGTYGSTNSTSTAQFKIAVSLTGNGLLQIPASPTTAVFFR